MAYYITGDCHGEFSKIKLFGRLYNLTTEDVLIVLGDFGLNFWLGKRDIKNKREFPTSNVIAQEKIEKLKCDLLEKKKNIWVAIHFFMDEVFYQVKDIDDTKERQFIYDFGKRLYKSMEAPSIFSYDFDIQEETKKLHYFVRTVDKEGLMQALEKHEKKVARYFK